MLHPNCRQRSVKFGFFRLNGTLILVGSGISGATSPICFSKSSIRFFNETSRRAEQTLRVSGLLQKVAAFLLPRFELLLLACQFGEALSVCLG